jgi:hypothetical protein
VADTAPEQEKEKISSEDEETSEKRTLVKHDATQDQNRTK